MNKKFDINEQINSLEQSDAYIDELIQSVLNNTHDSKPTTNITSPSTTPHSPQLGK